MRRLHLALLVLVVPASALPMPGQDDAGSGGDAGDHATLALPIGEGSYAGRVEGPADAFDFYSFVPAPSSVIRVRADATFFLLDPQGRTRDAGGVLDAVAEPQGTWHLRIAAALSRVDYTFTLAFERHAAVVAIPPIEEAAVAVEIDRQAGAWSFLEMLDDAAPQATGLEAEAHLFHTRFLRRDGTHGRFSIVVDHPDGGAPRVVAKEGMLDVDVAPARLLPATRTPAFAASFASESDWGQDVAFGTAWAGGTRVTGWLVYDGAPPVLTMAASRAWFLRSEDAEDRVVAVGPATFGEPRFAWDPAAATRLVVVDASGFTGGATAEVRLPDGTAAALYDERRIWWPAAAPAGEWRAAFSVSDVLEQDDFRVMAAEFPFEP